MTSSKNLHFFQIYINVESRPKLCDLTQEICEVGGGHNY